MKYNPIWSFCDEAIQLTFLKKKKTTLHYTALQINTDKILRITAHEGGKLD